MKPRHDPSNKPYYRCLACPNFRKLCGGRPTRDMDLLNWCEYICDTMDIAHLTNTYVAEKAEVSIKTIERIRARNTEQDIMRSTARRIEQVVLGPVTKHICDLDFETGTATEKITQLETENKELKRKLAEMDNLHRSDIRAVKAEYQEQLDFMKEELKAWRSWHQKQE